MAYGYDPHKGTEQFYDCDLPDNATAPISFWLRDNAKEHFVDVKMPNGDIVRSIFGETINLYVAKGGVVLPDARSIAA